MYEDYYEESSPVMSRKGKALKRKSSSEVNRTNKFKKIQVETTKQKTNSAYKYVIVLR